MAVNEADPRVKRTRKLLMDAFSELLHEKGFGALTVQDVAERATVNRATFYAHFTDKYDLLDRVVGDGFRARLAAGLPARAGFDAANLRRLVVVTLEAMAEFYGHCRPAQREAADLMEQRFQREVHEQLTTWLRPLTSRADARVTPDTAALTASWAIFGAGLEHGRAGDAASAAARADEVLEAALGILATAVEVPRRAPSPDRAREVVRAG